MKALIIYHSQSGNTKKVAESIAEGLKHKYTVTLIPSEKADAKNFSKYDLIGFGSGIYALKPEKQMLNLASLAPQDSNTFYFFTIASPLSFLGKPFEKALKHTNLLGSFHCKGFFEGGPLKLIGGINKGRPNASDLDDAKVFAYSL